MLEIFSIRSNEHISHEQSMIGTRADNADLDSVFLIPSCKTIDDVDSISRVQVVDSTFSVDSPYLIETKLVSVTP